MPDSIRVELGPRSYDILVGADLIGSAGSLFVPYLARPRVDIVTDETVGERFLAPLAASLESHGIRCASMAVRAGELSKSWASLGRIVDWLLERKIEREDAIVALGGGVVGDLAGFAAAITRRGVRLIQIPTTLLAQVDSSVGGKTGINSPHGKNLIGAFHQPVLVLADTRTLDSLPRRDFLSGYGEVAKYGLIDDVEFFAWLEENGERLLAGDSQALARAVRRSCEMKAEIVRRDEFETGDRALLNLGHTFGHALEAATGYSERLLHGEAVAIGCGLAFDLSVELGVCPAEDAARARRHFASMGMRSSLADIPGELPGPDALMSFMLQDKKVRAGRNRFVLARGIGKAYVEDAVELDTVRSILVRAAAGR